MTVRMAAFLSCPSDLVSVSAAYVEPIKRSSIRIKEDKSSSLKEMTVLFIYIVYILAFLPSNKV